MNPKEEVKELRKRLDKLEASLEEKLPFQKELDKVCASGYEIIEAGCNGVELMGRSSGKIISISSMGTVGVKGNRESYNFGSIGFRHLAELVKAVRDCRDC